MVYQTSLPDDHMAGTHWLHPHRHGSTALQVAGGAALALIVEDAPGTLLPAGVWQSLGIYGHLRHMLYSYIMLYLYIVFDVDIFWGALSRMTGEILRPVSQLNP